MYKTAELSKLTNELSELAKSFNNLPVQEGGRIIVYITGIAQMAVEFYVSNSKSQTRLGYLGVFTKLDKDGGFFYRGSYNDHCSIYDNNPRKIDINASTAKEAVDIFANCLAPLLKIGD